MIFKSSVALSGLSADAFGLSQPKTLSEQVKQDDPDDPSSASVKENVTIDHASRATFTLGVDSDDVDVFVVYDANNDGTFASDEIVGSSTGPAGTDEELTLIGPPDGNYQIWLHGFQVAGTPTVPLGIDIVQGTTSTSPASPRAPCPRTRRSRSTSPTCSRRRRARTRASSCSARTPHRTRSAFPSR